MSRHELATLAVKILGIYFIGLAAVSFTSAVVSLLSTLILAPPLAAEGLPLRVVPTTFLPGLVQMLVGFVLWRLAASIADRMLAGDQPHDLDDDTV